MRIIGGTLGRYFGWRFVSATVGIFVGILVLSALIDYIELMRRAGDVPDASLLVVA
jgi:lipopolysaccharide export system permease protein